MEPIETEKQLLKTIIIRKQMVLEAEQALALLCRGKRATNFRLGLGTDDYFTTVNSPKGGEKLGV